MARIPKYQQDRLASSLVGTPGVDTSGSMLAGKIGSMTNEAAAFNLQTEQRVSTMAQQQQRAWASAGESALNSVQKELNARMAVQRAIEKQLQANQDETETANKGAALQMQLSELALKLRTDYANNPEGVLSLWQKQGQALIDNYTMNTPMNDSVRSNVNKIGMSALTSENKSLNDYVFTQRRDNAEAELNANALQFINGAANGGNLEDFNRKMEIFNGSAPAYVNRYGPAEAQVKMAKVREGMASGLLSSMMSNYPDIAKNWAETALKPYLTGEQRRKFTEAADREMDANAAKAERLAKQQDHLTEIMILSEAEQANTVANDPKLITETRRKLQDMEDTELSKPVEQRNLTALKMLQSQKNQLDSQMNQIKAQAKADAKEIERDVKEATREAKAAAKAKADAAQKAAEDKYNSPEGENARAEVRKLMGMLSTDAKIVGTDAEAYAVVKAKEALMKAQEKGYLNLPGKTDQSMANQLGLLREKMQRIVDATIAGPKKVDGKVIKPSMSVSEAERFYEMLVKPAPDAVHNSRNPTGDIKKAAAVDAAFTAEVDNGVAAFTKAKQRPPTLKEIENIRSIVKANQITGRNR